MEDSFSKEEFDAINECLKSGRYTQGELVDKFEKEFAAWNNSKYAVMINSGSSANLLIIDLLKQKYGLQDSDEILVPAVTWPTTVYPIIQNNFSPVFCDVDEKMNISVESMKNMLTEKTKAVFVVHLLGQPANMQEIINFCGDNDLILIEDCCESTGAKIGDIKVGNFGIMGSFSFYFGHHMTTIEGGMIVTNDEEIYDLLKSTRSHGWVKGSNRMAKYESDPNKNFLFDMLGYNVRSTNLNAAIGLEQLKKLDGFIRTRIENHNYFLEKIKNTDLGYQKVSIDETTSFCLAIVFRDKDERDFVIKNLPSKGVETRPVVAGNLLRQPVFEKMNLRSDKTPNSDLIHTRGIYLPNNQFMSKEKIDYMLKSVNELVEEFRNG